MLGEILQKKLRKYTCWLSHVLNVYRPDIVKLLDFLASEGWLYETMWFMSLRAPPGRTTTARPYPRAITTAGFSLLFYTRCFWNQGQDTHSVDLNESLGKNFTLLFWTAAAAPPPHARLLEIMISGAMAALLGHILTFVNASHVLRMLIKTWKNTG